jgi:hypothetical protein
VPDAGRRDLDPELRVSFAGHDVPVDEPRRRELVALLTAAVLCNDATPPIRKRRGNGLD